jgi:(p)ppGpp synthase/HD superfamily hydrolase
VSRATTTPDLADRSQLLSVMPLHAITTTYGERGLRERLVMETGRLTDPAARNQVRRALQLAERLHACDRRQREPYVNHLLRVALRVTVHYDVWEPEMICAALLHDAVEDHADELSATGRQGAFTALAAVYGVRVAELVAAVTNPVYAPGSDKDRQYREHVVDRLAACPWARVIKLSDFTDNGVGVFYAAGEKAARLARKYAPLVPALAELAARPDTPLSDDVKTHILAQLGSATDRFGAIIAASAEGR